MMPVGCDQATAQEIALACQEVKAAIGDKSVRKVIYVPGRLVNVVVG
jgi:leucyl-tRNA synthetase